MNIYPAGSWIAFRYTMDLYAMDYIAGFQNAKNESRADAYIRLCREPKLRARLADVGSPMLRRFAKDVTGALKDYYAGLGKDANALRVLTLEGHDVSVRDFIDGNYDRVLPACHDDVLCIDMAAAATLALCLVPETIFDDVRYADIIVDGVRAALERVGLVDVLSDEEMREMCVESIPQHRPSLMLRVCAELVSTKYA
jgi:hypothetical protein